MILWIAATASAVVASAAKKNKDNITNTGGKWTYPDTLFWGFFK